MNLNTCFLLLTLPLFLACEGEKNKIGTEHKTSKVQENKAEVNPSIEQKKDFIGITFPSIDSLTISANYYEADPNAPIIVLCHQARFNKFEYAGIAPRLNKMGFNCLAIDQRSGGPISVYQNETMNRALKENRSIDYLDAEKDIISAVKWAYIKSKRPVILWGSSYSSTLALYVAMSNNQVGAVIAFSPGNYFSEVKGNLKEMLPNYNNPMFITSTKYENIHVKQFMSNVILKDKQIVFAPETEGYHGSQALWVGQPEGDQYWVAITNFLNLIR